MGEKMTQSGLGPPSTVRPAVLETQELVLAGVCFALPWHCRPPRVVPSDGRVMGPDSNEQAESEQALVWFVFVVSQPVGDPQPIWREQS